MRLAGLKSSIVMSFFLLIAAYTAAGKVIYVDADAQGPVYDGSSWATAFEYLREALKGATSGDEVRVAQGIYKPHEPVFLPPTVPPLPPPPDDRTATFQLKNGVVIRGGFAGFGEPNPNARDIEAYETILTGDLYGNDIDVNDPYDLFDEPTRTENSYHVVTASQVDQTSILDGFTIAAGNANNGDFYSPHCLGGGMYNNEASPTVIDCTFAYNSATAGGGMYNMNSSPTLRSCSFIGNSAHKVLYNGGSGGGMYTSSWACHPEVTTCVFEGNSAVSGGGIMSHGQPVITDCIFKKNSGGGMRFTTAKLTRCTFTLNRGGGLFISGDTHLTNCLFTANIGGGLQAQDCDIVVTNCSFIGNVTSAFFAGIWNDEGDTTVTNCISWGNIGKDGVTESAQIATHDPAVINYCCIQGWSGALGGTGSTDADPCFVSEGYWDTLPDFNEDYWYRHINWSDGDYHLLDDSPCIDAGDNAAVPTTVTTDLDGNPRIENGIVDMGAYESRAVFFVDIDATGANDGSSWADAYNYLQDALMMVPSGDEIRIAEGTYKPDQFVLSDRPNLGRIETFHLTNGVAIKGGYAGFGEPDPDARDIDVYKTILSGDLNSDDVEVDDPCDLLTEASRADNCYHVVTSSEFNYYGPNTILDGFTITGGNADGQYPDWELGAGGGMYNNESSPTVINCTFTENSARSGGGGIDNFGSWPYLINCTFSRNFSNWGGGLANGDSRPTLIDCAFIGNVSSYKGGAMACGDGSPPMKNCTFIDNRAVLGGAIYGGDSYPKATDCTFTGNSAEKGGVVYNNDSSILLINCTLSGNWATEGGAIYDDEGGSILINCTLTANTAISGGVLYSRDESYARLTNCILSNNSAVTGGVIYNGDESYARLTNCILSGNTAESGGVIYICDESNMELIHCTLAANSADNGDALACDSYQQQYPSSIEVTNCIFWNSGNEIWNNDDSVITIIHSDVQGDWAGEGNIDADPLFVEPGFWDTGDRWIEGDYRLGAASPCIDAGTDADVYEDVDGNVRPIDITGVDNNGELPDFDMGAYEVVATIQGKLIMQPHKVNRNAQGPKIFAFIQLPEPVIGEDIDMSEPLVLYPGGIEADEQKLLPDKTADDSVRIRAVFDRAELLAVTPDNGDVEVIVVGRFISGLYFYGTGTVTIK